MGLRRCLLVFLFSLWIVGASSRHGSSANDCPLTDSNACSGYFNFGIANIDVVQQRSEKYDTIYLSACITVGATSYCQTMLYGKHGQGDISGDIFFSNILIDPDAIVVFAYLAVNQGHGSISDNEYSLSNNTRTLSENAYQQVVSDPNPSPNVAQSIASLIGSTFVRVIEFLATIIEGIVDIFTEGCDGWVAGGLHGFTGQEICDGSVVLSQTDASTGDPDEKLFGFIPGVICSTQASLYEISWFAEVGNGTGTFTQPGYYFSGSSRAKMTSWFLGVVVLASLYIIFN
jgi:hypothetical protein